MAVRFPDQYAALREVDGLSDGAHRLLFASWFWVTANKTDGLVPRADLDLVLRGRRGMGKLAAECAARGAWHDARYLCESESCPAPVDRDGWVIHDYFAEMPRRAEAEACEEGKSKGGTEGNHRRWHLKRGIRKQGCDFCYPPLVGASDTDRISDRSTESDTDSRASDFDFDSRSGPSRSVKVQVKIKDLSDTDRISDDPSEIASDIRSADPAAVSARLAPVAAELAAKTGETPTDYDTQQVTALYLDRAAKTGKPLGDYIAYVIASVRKERDIAQVLAGVVPTRREIRAVPDEAAGDTHPFTPESQFSDTCAYPGCVLPRRNARHQTVRTA